MLVLSRKCGETIRIGDGVIVRVLEIRKNQVRLGVEAPASVMICREELLEFSTQGSAANRHPAPRLVAELN